jgi:hypothetical protein
MSGIVPVLNDPNAVGLGVNNGPRHGHGTNATNGVGDAVVNNTDHNNNNTANNHNHNVDSNDSNNVGSTGSHNGRYDRLYRYGGDDREYLMQQESNYSESKEQKTDHNNMLAAKGVDALESWSPYGAVKIERWLSKIDRISKMYKWTVEQKINATLLKISDDHCSDGIEHFLENLGDVDEDYKWAKLETYLRQLYHTDIDKVIVKQQLNNCRQDIWNKESIADFSKRFRNILAKLTNIDEEEKVDIYLTTIDARLMSYILNRMDRSRIKSLIMCERLAIEAEINQHAIDKQNDRMMQQQQRSPQPQHNTDIRPRYIINNRNNFKRGRGHYLPNRYSTETTATENNGNVLDNAQNTETIPSPGSMVSQSNIRCYNCGGTGHYAARCRNKGNNFYNYRRNSFRGAGRGRRGGGGGINAL